MFLYDNVLVVREAARDRSETQMRSTFMHVVQSRSVVSTDRDVVITEEDRVLSGRGMEYHNNSNEMFLRENVRGRLEPRKRENPEP